MFLEYLQKDPRTFFAVCITVVVSICVHELAHGVAAIWRGDRTPIESGHMTLNPAVHMGPFSIVMLLLAGIAWGAMPINPTRMRAKYAEAMVAFAGPLSNIVMAVIGIGIVGLWQRYDDRTTDQMGDMLTNLQFLFLVFGITNVHLAMFNMIPIPPLDGARILSNFSESFARTMDLFTMSGGYFIIFIMLFSATSRFTSEVSARVALALLQVIRGF
jgi:Zn-dependent protease